jgi:putative PEP-CTERM system TPR-repeat lipoprotein
MAGYRLLAGIQIARHQPDQAAATLAKAPAARKPGSETFDPIGRGDAAADQPDTARVTFQPALAPDDGAAVTLGHTLEFAPKLPAATEAPFYDALAIGDPDKAAAELTLIKETQGETAVTGNLTGLLALARIDLPAARTAFESVIKAYPDAMEAHINLARVLTMMGERNEADALLADLLARQPALEPALEMLASSYGRDGRQEDAVRLFEAAQAAEPANVGVLLALGDLYIRVGHARKILDLVAGQTGLVAASIDVRGLKAAALIALGEKQAARETYAAILDTDPKAMDARRRLGALLVENGAFEQARAVVAAGIAIAPRSYPIHLDLALIDLKDGGLDAALATADQLAARQPAFVALLGLRGDVELAANRPDDAVAAFADAYARDSDSGLVVRLADAQLRAARKDDAARTLAGWLAGHPDDLRVRELASEVDIRRDRLDDAAGHLAAILKRQPHDAVALNNLAWIFQQTGDPRAEGLARQAYVIAPGPQTSDTLGWILTSANDPETGVALLRRAVGESPTDPHLQYHYAVALQKTGRKEEAIRVLNRVVAAGGEFDEKTEARKLLEALEGT